jgi:hypothetical protein
MLNMQSRRCVLCPAVFLLLAACSKSPAEMGCADPEIQTMARKLVVLYVQDAMTTKTDTQRTLDSYTKQANRNSGLDTTLNTLKAQSVKIDSVSLSEITEIRNPQSATSSAEQSVGASSPKEAKADRAPKNATSDASESAKALYVCSARASISLPPSAVERFATLGKSVPNLVDASSSRIAPYVVYETKLNSSKALEMGLAMRDPLVHLTLQVLLRDKAPASSAGAPQ